MADLKSECEDEIIEIVGAAVAGIGFVDSNKGLSEKMAVETIAAVD